MSAEREEARNMCHLAAVETIQDITTFCLDYADAVHVGLSWYATYFLFQASVVLSIHHLKPVPQLDRGLAAVNRELWLSSVERARGCFASLGATNRAAMRCLAVLDRIRDRSPRELAQAELEGQPQRLRAHAGAAYQSDPLEAGIADASVAPLTVDPTLQMFFEDTSWENDLFEGLNGFPGTDEVDLSESIPGSSGSTVPLI
jgi:transcriptional regulatory protein GAL4